MQQTTGRKCVSFTRQISFSSLFLGSSDNTHTSTYIFLCHCISSFVHSDYNVNRPKLNQLSGRRALPCNVKVNKVYTLETPQLQAVIAQLVHMLVTLTKPSSQPSPHCPLAQVTLN